MSAPTIQGRIPSGSGQITGTFTHEEAKDLSLILRSGSLPIPIKIISKEVIGPTLGKELLDKGLFALLTGLIAIFVFMVFRYRFSGLIAFIALLVNGLIIFAILAP